MILSGENLVTDGRTDGQRDEVISYDTVPLTSSIQKNKCIQFVYQNKFEDHRIAIVRNEDNSQYVYIKDFNRSMYNKAKQ